MAVLFLVEPGFEFGDAGTQGSDDGLDLRSLGVDEHEMPGRNPWITALCRKAGCKPRFIGSVDGVTHVLSRVASDACVTLLPDYFLGFSHPGVTFKAVSDAHARWDFMLLRQKGKMTPPMRSLVEALQRSAERLR